VAWEGFQAFACAPVPDLDGAVHGPRDELRVVELNAADSRLVAVEGADFPTGVDVPDFDGGVVGAGDEDVVVELEAHHSVCVAFEDLGGASAVFPVCADFEAILVDVLPGSSV
jgi:hypothetical protein